MSEQSSTKWVELTVKADHEAVESVSELFAQYGFNEGVAIEEPFLQEPDGDNLRVDYSKPVTIRTYVAAADMKPADLEAIQRGLWHLGQMRSVSPLEITHRDEEDWANAWKEHYRPLRASKRVVVRPPWFDYEAEGDDVVLELDPGMAFGTGTHPSTRLCLMGIEQAMQSGDRMLDVGTGSGILAIAAAKLGASHIDAVDNEMVAVRSAQENVERNGVAETINVAFGSVGPDGPFRDTYDVVIANIISRILIDLSESLAAAMRPGGKLILSGVVEPREPLVLEAFGALGLELIGRNQIEDWVGLTYRKP